MEGGDESPHSRGGSAMMPPMRACGLAQGVTGAALIAVFSFAGCGGSNIQAADTTPSTATPAGATGETHDDPADPTSTGAGGEGSGEGTTSEGGESGGDDSETRSTDVIRKVIMDRRDAFRTCYEKGKKELPTLQGNMTLHFTLDPEGKVKSAELNQERSDLKSPVVVDCSLAELKKIKFPPSSRGMETTVNYPFNFNP